jgi:hypothetical protein
MSEIPIACDLSALTPEQRLRHSVLAAALFGSTQETQELPNGYRLRLDTDGATWQKAAEFVDYERLCCPFFHFTLEVEPGGGNVWLQLTGREGVKEFLTHELADILRLTSTKRS